MMGAGSLRAAPEHGARCGLDGIVATGRTRGGAGGAGQLPPTPLHFTELERRRIEHVLGAFCRTHRPRSAEPYVRLYYRVRGRSVVLVEDRRHYLDESHWVTVPIARLRFATEERQWSLDWRRASGRWSPYPGWIPAANLEHLLDEISRDPERLFWG